MSVSTDGQICYGIPFEEGFEFPWEAYDIEKWWRSVNGFKHSVEIYSDTDKSGYVGGKKPSQSVIDEYHLESIDWLKANPLPVELVNYCSDDAPMYMLAVPESFKRNCRGDTVELNPTDFQPSTKGWEQHCRLVDFCQKYLGEKIAEFNDEEYNDKKIVLDPKWYLTSYWG